MKIIKKALVYILGIWIITLGVVLSVNMGIGVSPVSALPNAISMITKIDLGTCMIVIYTSYLLIQIILLRKAFSPDRLLQAIGALTIGYCAKLSKIILAGVYTDIYILKLVAVVFGAFLIGIGVSIYVGIDFPPIPPEGTADAITKVSKLSFHDAKVIVDVTGVAIATILSLVFLGGLYGVREGSLIAAVLAGKFIPVVKPYTAPIVKWAMESK